MLREKEIKTKNSQNHTISCLNLFICFVFNQSRGRRENGKEDECVQVQVDGGHPVCLAPCFRNEAFSPHIQERQRCQHHDTAPEFFAACVLLHLHARDFIPRSPVPVGQQP